MGAKMVERNKLVLAWVDMDGFELTGNYSDRLRTYPETRAIPQGKAACWSFDSSDSRASLLRHIETEKKDHLWMGWFLLPFKDNILAVARTKALETFKQESKAK